MPDSADGAAGFCPISFYNRRLYLFFGCDRMVVWRKDICKKDPGGGYFSGGNLFGNNLIGRGSI